MKRLFNHLKLFLILSLMPLFTLTAEAQKAAMTTDSLARLCHVPQSEIYKKQHDFEKLDVTLITDYESLNQRYQNDPVRGVIRISKKDGSIEEQPVLLSQRGNSRRQMCDNPPFRIQFLKPEIKEALEAELKKENIDTQSEAYLPTYFKKLTEASIQTETDVVSLKQGIFKGLGDDIKVVTHCGESTWEMVGGANEASQYKKLLAEYTVYKILDTLKLPVEHTRLINMTYLLPDGSSAHKNTDGQKVSKLAFFREPPKSVAERCGLYSKLNPDLNLPKQGEDDSDSQLLVRFINQFVFNNDFELYGHNVNIFYDRDGRKVYGAYDFDLSGLVVDNYSKNAKNLKDQAPLMMKSLEEFPKEKQKIVAQKILDNKKAMKKVIDDSEIDQATKEKLIKWLDFFSDELKKVLK